MNLSEYSSPTALLHGREPRLRYPLLATGLALLCPGLGHLYQGRRLLSGLFFAITLAAVSSVNVLFIGLGANSFTTYYALIGLAVLFWLSQVVHAALLAWRSGDYHLTRDNHVPTYVLFAAHFWVLVLVGAYLQKTYVASLFTMEAIAMAPTVLPGDELFISKLDSADLHYGEVVLYEHHVDAASTAFELELGRVFGLPGDLVESVNGEWYRNDALVEMREVGPLEVLSRGIAGIWQMEEMLAYEREEAGTRFRVLRALDWHGKADSEEFRLYEVPAGHVYLLADNLDGHWDSRDYGAIRMTEIVGRPTMVWGEKRPERFSLDRVGHPIE